MKRWLSQGRIGAWLLVAALFQVPVQAQPARYELDPDHLSIGFLVEHLGYAKVLGLFRAARGGFSFDEATGTLSDVRIEVDTQSVFTNSEARDRHLKGKDFLHSSEHPRMVFSAASARRVGDRQFEIPGELELLGKRQPLVLRATWNKSAASPIDKSFRLGASATASLQRSAFGMSYGVANRWVGDEVSILIEFEAQRK